MPHHRVSERRRTGTTSTHSAPFDAAAQTNLGVMYGLGRGVSQDDAIAADPVLEVQKLWSRGQLKVPKDANQIYLFDSRLL